ncbi:TPA: 3-oxoacyl-ACP synthase [bacterium]|nr:3-oxoacyl-ACP synthase [bacterium]
MKKAKIIATGSYVPKKVLTNQSLEEIVDTSDDWIIQRTGIKERRIAEEETAVDLAYLAVKDMDYHDIDLVIVSTSTPDYTFPSTACLVSERLSLSNVACFDISAACTGFLYALECGRFFIESGKYKKALIIATEKTSKIIDWKDRSTCVLFGDGAGACILAPSYSSGITGSYFNSNGKLGDILKVDHYIKMEGQEVFKYAIIYMTEAIQRVLESTSLKIDDIDLFIPHQANIRIINLMGKRLDIPQEKTYINLEKYGNVVSASSAIALDEAVKEGKVKEGDIILMVAIGGGFTWGAMVIKW